MAHRARSEADIKFAGLEQCWESTKWMAAICCVGGLVTMWRAGGRLCVCVCVWGVGPIP